MLLEAKRAQIEDLLFRRWIPYQTVISYDDFKKSLTPQKLEDEGAILERVEGYMEQFEAGYKEV